MKTIIKSPYPCLVKTPSQEVELEEESSLIVTDEAYLFVYPLKSGLIPFKVTFDGKKSEFYEFFSYNNQNYIVFSMPPSVQIVQTENLNFNGKICKVKALSNKISFEINDKIVEINCQNDDKKIFKLNSFACVQTDNDFFAYNTKNNKLSHFSGQNSLSGNVLTVTKNFHDSLSRTKTAKYILKENIELENENILREEKKTIRELVPYKLLESVKAKDFEFAINLLAQPLKDKVDEAKLCDFFGNFTSFLPISTTEFITLSNKEKNFVTFCMQDDKVCDITVNAL